MNLTIMSPITLIVIPSGIFIIIIDNQLIKIYIMTPEQKKWLKLQIEVKMRREPETTLLQLKHWIKKDTEVDWESVKKTTFHMFVKENRDKWLETGSLKRKEGTGGSNQISLAKKVKIKRLGVKKLNAGNRVVAAKVGVSHTTVRNVLKETGHKSYHRRKVQAMTPEQMAKRVTCSNWLLANIGRTVRDGRSKWSRVLNTDFSGKI